MASSGSFDTGNYQGRYLTFSWSVASQSISGNYTVINWSLTGAGTASSSWYYTYAGYVNIAGERVWTQPSRGNSGGEIKLYNGTVLASGSKTIYHGSDGRASFSADAGAGIWTYAVNCTGSGSWELPQIARYSVIQSATDFNDESNPTITFTNPSGGYFPLRAKLEAGGNNKFIIRDISSTATSYTFNLTDEERTRLRNLTPNNNSLSVVLTICCMNGETELSSSYLYRTMAIVNANPIFNDFSFEDVNEKTLELTGNNQNIIRGYSNVKATIPVVNKAEALKSATMSKYRLNCNGNSTDITYSSDSDVEGTLNGVKSGVFDVYAIDSRNNSTLVTKNANSVIDYTPIVKGNISVARTNGVSESVTLKLDGKVDLVNFGVVTNEIKQSKYRYRATDSAEWSDYNDLELTVDADGNFTFNDLISGDTEELGFNINNSYQVEVLIADELSQVVYTATFGSGIPNIALSKNGVGIMGKYDEEVGGLLQVGGKRIDDVYSTEERVIGVWTKSDGTKVPLYRISYLINVGTEIEYILDISSLNADELMLDDSHSYFKQNVYTLQFGYYAGSTDWSRMYRASNTIILQFGSVYTMSKNAVVTLEYTKTTD